MLESNSNGGLDRFEKVAAFQIESERIVILLESLPAAIRSDSLKQTMIATMIYFISQTSHSAGIIGPNSCLLATCVCIVTPRC